jgi:large subunit ribosomal protein L23
VKSPYDIIVRPLVTEKTMGAIERHHTYTFVVDVKATKPEIRRAVERAFNVKVEDVRTLRRKGKRKARRMARFLLARRPDWKRALVTLQEGQRIDIL